MGVSQWKNAGKKYGYWDYFQQELIKQIEEMKEDNLGETPSHNEDMGVENMYDWISSNVGFEEDKKELREGIRLFGKMRFNQALNDIIKLIKEQ